MACVPLWSFSGISHAAVFHSLSHTIPLHHLLLSRRARNLQLDEKLSDFEFPDDFVLDVYEMVNAG